MFYIYTDMKIIGLSKVSGKAQTTIPKDVLEALKLSSGDKIVYFMEDGKIYVQKA